MIKRRERSKRLLALAALVAVLAIAGVLTQFLVSRDLGHVLIGGAVAGTALLLALQSRKRPGHSDDPPPTHN